jgi:acetyltransferase-like isoleucine patch superfamily enzyme
MIDLFHRLRFMYLVHVKWRHYSFGKNPYIGRMVYMWAKHIIQIGDNFYIGKFSQIECDAIIGNNVMLANRVALVGRYDHNYQQIGVPIRMASKIRDSDYSWKGLDLSVIIEDDVWVGYGTIILSGVRLGKGSIIASGSVVTKDVEPYSIFGGVPAKKIGTRFENDKDLNEHIRLYDETYSDNNSSTRLQ